MTWSACFSIPHVPLGCIDVETTPQVQWRVPPGLSSPHNGNRAPGRVERQAQGLKKGTIRTVHSLRKIQSAMFRRFTIEDGVSLAPDSLSGDGLLETVRARYSARVVPGVGKVLRVESAKVADDAGGEVVANRGAVVLRNVVVKVVAWAPRGACRELQITPKLGTLVEWGKRCPYPPRAIWAALRLGVTGCAGALRRALAKKCPSWRSLAG